MKKIYIICIIVLLLIPYQVNATGGGLRKSSLKTCPNGITYGMHSDGNGGTHWHEAETNGKNYYAKGNAIYYDPCSNSNTNEGVTNITSESNNSSLNNSTNNTNQISESKNGDNSIKRIIIDGKEITISDEMNYQASSKNIDIKIELNSDKATVNFENKELKVGNNNFEIKVIAENGDIKTYRLNINRNKVVGKATIKNFTLGAGNVDFINNKASIKKLKNESSLDYSYELSDENATLKIYLNDEETTKLESLKENDIVKLIVFDENDNENIYEITITNASLIFSFIVYGMAILIMLSPIIIITIIILKKIKI